MRRVILIMASLLAGCAIRVEPGTTDAAKFASGTHEAASSVEVLSSRSTGARDLGKIEAMACQKALHEPLATNEAALTLLKAKAAGLGANALVSVEYRHQNLSLLANCRDTIFATGDALAVPR